MAKTPDPPMVRVVVHPRRSVMYQIPSGAHRTAAGGEMIEVPPAEAAYLRAHGFLHEPNAPAIETQTGQARGSWSDTDDPRPTINGDDGTVVRGG